MAVQTAALTAAGKPVSEDYDLVLAHEHLQIDIRCWFDGDSAEATSLSDVVVSPETAHQVQTNPFACLDNLVLPPRAEMIEELGKLEKSDDVLLIEVTPANVGRSPHDLAAIEEALEIDIVFGCGRYIAESRPGEPESPPEIYRDEILSDFDQPPPRPSVVGEIGTGAPISPIERNGLIGAVMAQRELGVPIYVHLHPWGQRGEEVLDLVDSHGGDLGATVLCHLDVQIPVGLDYHRKLLARGCTIAFDLWGDEFAYGAARMPTDTERLHATLTLIDEGYGGQLVHSHDVCTKTQLRRNGGPGFAHLPARIVPRMRELGMDDEAIHDQVAGNAVRLLGRSR
jgi:phosphotriesterase-related protein